MLSINVSCENVSYVAPAKEYLAEVDGVTLGFTITAIIFTAVILVLYGIQFKTIHDYISIDSRRSIYHWMAAIFPVTAFCCIIGVCIPRALAPMDVFILLMFARVMFLFDALIHDLLGGKEGTREAIKGTKIKIQQPPCCCCCKCLPQIEPTQRNLRWIYWVSIQVAIVRPILVFIMAVAVADGAGKVHKGLDSACSVVNIVSTMLSMWGLTISTSFSAEPLKEYAMGTMFSLLKGIIITYNLQGAVFNLLANADVIKCDRLVTDNVKARMWHHLLLTAEVLLFSLSATWKLRAPYNAIFDKHPLNKKKVEEPTQTNDVTPHVVYDNPAAIVQHV